MEKTQVDNAFLKNLKKLIQNHQNETLIELIDQMYPQDIAEAIDKLEPEDVKLFMSFVEKEKRVKVLVEMEDNVRFQFLSGYTTHEIAKDFIEDMDSDDAVDLLSQFPAKSKNEIIANLSDIEFASQLLSLLNYEEHTAGSRMAVELVKADLNWTVARCIEEIRSQAENVSNIYVVYVVDDFERLMGFVTLEKLILSPPSSIISNIYENEVISVSSSLEVEEVAMLTQKYDLFVMPVVDALGRLVGRITIDDVVDVIKEEADEDYQLMSGITEDVDATDKVWKLSRARLPWLLIGLLGGIASSRFIELYESEIQIRPQMAFFIPLVAAMGGNAGIQSSAIVVQGLANNTIGTKNIVQKLLKEMRVALINGIICSAALLLYSLFFLDKMDISVTVSVALLSVIIIASMLGTFIPLFLNSIKIDPAIATGPFITTTNDLLGLAIYFSLGHFMYSYFR